MASMFGENKIILTQDVIPGMVRAEAYINLCEPESVKVGKLQYHSIIELVDYRGGVEVRVAYIPVPNQNSDNGHVTEADALDLLTEPFNTLVDGITGAIEEKDHQTSEVIRVLYYTGIKNELLDEARSMLMDRFNTDEDGSGPNPLNFFS